MKKILLILPLLALSCGQTSLVGGDAKTKTSPVATQDVDLQAFSQSNNQFAFDLYQKMTKQHAGENLFVSPASISIAFGMAYSGAADKTQKNMADVMHLDLNQSLVDASFKKLIGTLSGKKATHNFDLAIANRFWSQKDFGWLPSYLDNLALNYQSGVTEYDFRLQAERDRALVEINDWASKNTNGKIPQVITDQDLSEDTRFVLTNAVYFQGEWQSQFPRDEKRGLPKMKFYPSTAAGKGIETDFLVNETHLKYHEESGLQVVELPYKATKPADMLSMVIMLPAKNSSVSQLLGNLDAAKFNALMSKLNYEKVNVAMPAFEVKQNYKLGPLFKGDMAMDLAFSDFADFSKMNGRKDIKIGEVIHNTFIKVDNKGTEAAAVTAIIGVLTTSIDVDLPINFTADRPFVYAIRHNATNAILFMGTLENPVN